MYEANRTLWVGNLSPEVDEELLFELFLQVGPLDNVTILKTANNFSKGYGFVNFKHECSVVYAMALMNGITLFGKRILLQKRTTVGKIPNHEVVPVLQNFRRTPYQRPRNQRRSLPANAFQGYHIPVLGATQGSYPENPMVQSFVQQSPSQYFLQNSKRRRTYHGFEFKVNCHYGMGNMYNPHMARQNNSHNIVLCDHTVDNCTPKPKEDLGNTSTGNGNLNMSTQDRPYVTIYDQHRLQKKY